MSVSEAQTDQRLSSFGEYRGIQRMNASTLVHGMHSMRRLKRMIDSGGVDEVTMCMQLGIATHALLLEPEDFERQYVVMPDFHLDAENVTGGKNPQPSQSKATNYYKEKVKQFAVENAGRIIIERQAYDKCLYAIECLRSHHTAPSLLVDSKPEQTVIGEIEGIPFKGRIDLLGKGWLADLKTSNSVHPHAFGRTAANQCYDFKLAIYRELVRQDTGVMPDVFIIAQEIGGDFDTCCIEVDSIVLDNAYSEVCRVIKKYKQAQETGKWHGVDDGKPYLPLVVPNWRMRDEEVELDWEDEA